MAENKQDAIDSTKTEPVMIVPPNTHTSPTTHESIAPREIAAGTSIVSAQPVATRIVAHSPQDPASRGEPVPSSTHGARITPAPASRDTTGR